MITIIVGIICFLCGIALGAQIVRIRYEREHRMIQALQDGILAAYVSKIASDMGSKLAKEKAEEK